MTLPRSLAVLLPLLLGIEAAEAPEPAWRVAERDRVVLAEPADGSAVRGRIRAGDSFAVLGSAEGPGCEAGWLILPGHGYLCGAGTEVTDRPPVAQPALVSYDPPEPAEYAHYVDTGEYDASEPVELVPGIYAKRYRRFGGPLYADVAAYEAGAAPIGRLVRRIGSKYHFVEVAKTARGDVLVRADGQVAPVDQVYLYPVSRLQGRDLVDEPLELGQWPAFAVDYSGAPVHEAPDFDSAVHTTLAYHTPLAVRSAPVGDGHWWAVPHALGPGVDGYVNDRRSVRHPVLPEARPDGVGDDERWVGVELGQQVIQVFEGDTLVWFSLTSTGAAPMGTPVGIYTIYDKRATRTMRSRPSVDPADAYVVEDVPWTMYFRPGYALHAAYWHWGFGRPASHGCINLSPADARWIWERVGPELPDGWSQAGATDEAPGTTLMVWRAGRPVPDRR